MSHTIIFNPEWQVIEITFQGALSLEELKETYSEVVPMALEHDCFLFLNDLSDAKIQLSIYEVVAWANTISEIIKASGRHPGLLKRAIILPVHYKDSKFAENVALNRGHPVKFFKSTDDARNWLREK